MKKQALKDRIIFLRKELDEARNDYSNLNTELYASRKEVQGLVRKLNEVSEELDAHRKRFVDQQFSLDPLWQVDNLTREVATLRKEVNDRDVKIIDLENELAGINRELKDFAIKPQEIPI